MLLWKKVYMKIIIAKNQDGISEYRNEGHIRPLTAKGEGVRPILELNKILLIPKGYLFY